MKKSKVIETVSDPSDVLGSREALAFDIPAFDPSLEDLLHQYAHIDETREALERYGAELSRLAEETARGKAETQTRAERTREFFSSAASQIRASLGQLLEMTSAALKGKRPCGTETVEVIGRELALSLSLVEDLACLSRLEMSAPETHSTEFDLKPVLESALNEARTAAERKGLKLEFKQDPKLPARVLGDSEKLSEVLKRLLLNSVDTTQSGTVELEAEVLSSNPREIKLRFFVNDEGYGYSEEQRVGLFQSVRNQGGDNRSGHPNVRLTICKRLADEMGGVLGVNSLEGIGSSYWLFLKFLSC